MTERVTEHRTNLDERTKPPEGHCEQCSTPWCKFNITPDNTIEAYTAGNRDLIRNLTCNDFQPDTKWMRKF